MTGNFSGQLFESMTLGRVIATLFASVIASFLIDILRKPSYPSSLPRVGYGESVIATIRNWIGYVLYFTKWVDEGYEKVPPFVPY
jgi:hypothetical protein